MTRKEREEYEEMERLSKSFHVPDDIREYIQHLYNQGNRIDEVVAILVEELHCKECYADNCYKWSGVDPRYSDWLLGHIWTYNSMNCRLECLPTRRPPEVNKD